VPVEHHAECTGVQEDARLSSLRNASGGWRRPVRAVTIASGKLAVSTSDLA